MSWPMLRFLSGMIVAVTTTVVQQDFSHGDQFGGYPSSDSEIVSGFICEVRYGLNDNGSPKSQKCCTKTWFDGNRLRTDDYIGDVLTACQSEGRSAFPAAGRIFDYSAAYRKGKSYPDRAREYSERLLANRQPIGSETLKGFLCEKYAWHEEGSQIGCISIPAHDVTYWINDDPRFPVLMKSEMFYEGKPSSRNEVTEMSVNASIPPSAFELPTGLKPVQPWSLPARPFEIEVHHRRESREYGWTSDETTHLSGDGKGVTYEYILKNDNENGRTHVSSDEKILSYPETQQGPLRWLSFSEWAFFKKVGERVFLEMAADELECVVENVRWEKIWVVDHSVMGTTRVRWEYESCGVIEVHEVLILSFP